jgi:hypothetical protein
MADIKLPGIVKLYKQPLHLPARKKLVHPPSARGMGGGGRLFDENFFASKFRHEKAEIKWS